MTITRGTHFHVCTYLAEAERAAHARRQEEVAFGRGAPPPFPCQPDKQLCVVQLKPRVPWCEEKRKGKLKAQMRRAVRSLTSLQT